MVDTSAIVTEVVDDLAAENAASLTWWTEAELWDAVNDAILKLCRDVPIHVEVTTPAPGTVMNLAARHLALYHAFFGPHHLDPKTDRDMKALRSDWKTVTALEPIAYVRDSEGPLQIRLYPAPTQMQTVELVEETAPAPVSSGSPVVALPRPAADYIEWTVLGQVRSREGRATMPEIQKVSDSMAAVLLAAFTDLYGDGGSLGK